MESVADHNSDNMLLLCVFDFVKKLFGSKPPLLNSACCFSSAKLTTQKIKMLQCCHKVVEEHDAWCSCFAHAAELVQQPAFHSQRGNRDKMQRLDGKPLQSFEPTIPEITGPFFVEITAVVFDLSQSWQTFFDFSFVDINGDSNHHIALLRISDSDDDVAFQYQDDSDNEILLAAASALTTDTADTWRVGVDATGTDVQKSAILAVSLMSLFSSLLFTPSAAIPCSATTTIRVPVTDNGVRTLPNEF